MTGNAFTLGYFRGNRRVESEFVSSQLLALDLDDCPLSLTELEMYPFITDYAYLMYPTPSSTPDKPKTRVLFVLDEPVEGEHAARRWRMMQLGLMEYFRDLKPDDACKDPARLFYGSECRGYYVDYLARLPLEIAGGLALNEAEADMFSLIRARYTVQKTREDKTGLRPLIEKWLSTAWVNLSSVPDGQRHKAFIRYACWLYGLDAGGWPLDAGEIERFMLAYSASCGGDEHAARANLKWAAQHAKPIGTDDYEVRPVGRRAELKARMERYSNG